MKVTLLTYNTLFNKGIGDLKLILQENPNIDIVCLQEVDTEISNLNKISTTLGLKLADFSNSFVKFGKIFGVATYYNSKKFSVKKNLVLNLPRSMYEILLFILKGGNKSRTVLQTYLEFKKENKPLTVYNVHLTHLVSSNGTRIKQMNSFLSTINSKQEPIIIAGDFNFMYNKKRFEKIIERYNLKEATNNINYTNLTRVLKIFSAKVKLDYILYRNIKKVSTVRLEKMSSDHYPVISKFTLTKTLL